MQVWNLLHAARCKYRMQKSRQKSPSGHHRTTSSGYIFTFCVSRRRRKMYCGHAHLLLCLCVCVCLSAAVCPHYCTDPDVTWQRGRGCPLVVHYWAHLQSVHGLWCYGKITWTLVVKNLSHWWKFCCHITASRSLAHCCNLWYLNAKGPTAIGSTCVAHRVGGFKSGWF